VNVLAFDPGLCTGVCHLSPGYVRCGILDDETWGYWFDLANNRSATVYIEKPVIYPRGHKRPNDLITLALRAGELAGACPSTPVRYVEPAEWKRQLPKDVCHGRILEKLTPSERTQIDNVMKLVDSKRHNALDALGIALWATGRKVI
jgi:hypothetical protein